MPIEIHFESRIVNQNVIRDADAKSHRDYVIVTVLAAMFLLSLFVYGWQHYRWIQYGYRIQEAQKKKEHMTEMNQRLSSERATLHTAKRIDSIARRDLGMVVPVPGQLISVQGDAPLATPPADAQQPGRPSAADPRTEPAAIASKR